MLSEIFNLVCFGFQCFGFVCLFRVLAFLWVCFFFLITSPCYSETLFKVLAGLRKSREQEADTNCEVT